MGIMRILEKEYGFDIVSGSACVRICKTKIGGGLLF